MLQKQLPNIPFLGWLEMQKMKSSNESGCSLYPNIYDIEYRNSYWQIFRHENHEWHLYGAYLGKVSLPSLELTRA